MGVRSQPVFRNKGVFASEQAALDTVVRLLVEAFDPACIWLFGSRARGTHRPDSDFDLLCVAKSSGCFGSNDYEKLVMPLVGLGVGCDIVPCSAEDFEEAAGLKTTLVAQILQHGRKIYEAKTN